MSRTIALRDSGQGPELLLARGQEQIVEPLTLLELMTLVEGGAELLGRCLRGQTTAADEDLSPP